MISYCDFFEILQYSECIITVFSQVQAL